MNNDIQNEVDLADWMITEDKDSDYIPFKVIGGPLNGRIIKSDVRYYRVPIDSPMEVSFTPEVNGCVVTADVKVGTYELNDDDQWIWKG
jgi:hypothetical protein